MKQGASSSAAKYRSGRLFAGPSIGTALTMLLLGVGAVASLASTEIRESFQLAWQSPGTLLDLSDSQPVWLTFFVALLLVALSLKRNDALAQQSQELIAELDSISENFWVLGAMPKEVLNAFRRHYALAKKPYYAVLNTQSSAEQLETAIRYALSQLLDVVMVADRGEKSDGYAANVMIYRRVGELGDEKEQLNAHMPFLRDAEAIDGFEAILELRQELSTISGEENLDRTDSNIGNLVLQVPDSSAREVLPGAPMVVFDSELGVKGYKSLAELSDYMTDSDDFSEADRKRVQMYFDKQKDVIGSFVSIAINRPWFYEQTDPIPPPLAVLNIHRKGTGLLSLEEQTALFSELVGPFRSLLFDLIEAWCIRKQISGAPIEKYN